MVRIGGSYSDWGRGQYNSSLPEDVPVEFASFAGGYDSSDRREDIPVTGSPSCVDVEVDSKDRLIRAPGVLSVEQMGARLVKYLIPHASMDFRSELLMFDPPYIGFKSDEGTVWVDVGLDAAYTDEFASTNYAGVLIFTNGIKTYSRKFLEQSIEELEEMPIALAYASFAGRVFALSPVIEGTRQIQAISWNSVLETYDNWTGLGAGHEFLISDMAAGDYGVALNPMGLDLMAVMMRRSIWVARRTGLVNRPADIRPAVAGVGAINADVCKTTMQGVVFLSDTGVHVFDGNRVQHISAQIDNDLLELDYDNLSSYKALYEIRTNRYYLITPDETWVYDFKYQRWYRWSLIAKFAVEFAPQLPSTTWADLVGQTWADLAGTRWSDFAGREGQRFDTYFIADVAGVHHLGKVDTSVETFFGAAQTPQWDFVQKQGRPTDLIYTTKKIFVEYLGSGQISLHLPDQNAEFELVVTQTLAPKVRPSLTPISTLQSGRGIGLRLTIGLGSPKVTYASLIVMPRSSSQMLNEFVAREYEADF